MIQRRVKPFELDGMTASNELLSSFNVAQISPTTLLFQSGYLTIEREDLLGGETHYQLSQPNLEVRLGLNRNLLNQLVGSEEVQSKTALSCMTCC